MRDPTPMFCIGKLSNPYVSNYGFNKRNVARSVKSTKKLCAVCMSSGNLGGLGIYLLSNMYTDSFKKGSVNLQMFLRRKLIFKRRNGQKKLMGKNPSNLHHKSSFDEVFHFEHRCNGPVQWLKGVK